MSKQVKSNYEIIKSIKKANKVAREKMAAKAGFKSSESYIQFLEGNGTIAPKAAAPKKIAAPKETITGTFEKRPKIHIVDVLDASGSMNDDNKYEVAKEGIWAGINALKTVNEINYTYSLTEFVQSNIIEDHFFLSPKFPTEISFAGARGFNTPLYKTVYELLVKLHNSVSKEDKVLVKVYTDGINNTAHNFQHALASLITKVNSENITVTFVATDEDLSKIVSALNLDGSNTLAVSNNKAGFKKAFETSNIATMSFSAKVLRGEPVLKGFYKKSGTL